MQDLDLQVNTTAGIGHAESRIYSTGGEQGTKRPTTKPAVPLDDERNDQSSPYYSAIHRNFGERRKREKEHRWSICTRSAMQFLWCSVDEQKGRGNQWLHGEPELLIKQESCGSECQLFCGIAGEIVQWQETQLER